MASFEHQRPELNQTILFGETPVLDSEAIEAQNGRMVPSYNFSHAEFEKLWKIARQQDEGESLELFQVPPLSQITRIEISRPYGCWELNVYDDKKNRARYGRLAMSELTNSTLAHRVMYMVFYGEESLKDGQVVDHICENKACCYPRHLQPVTGAQNTRLGIIAHRHARGQLGFDYGD